MKVFYAFLSLPMQASAVPAKIRRIITAGDNMCRIQTLPLTEALAFYNAPSLIFILLVLSLSKKYYTFPNPYYRTILAHTQSISYR